MENPLKIGDLYMKIIKRKQRKPSKTGYGLLIWIGFFIYSFYMILNLVGGTFNIFESITLLGIFLILLMLLELGEVYENK